VKSVGGNFGLPTKLALLSIAYLAAVSVLFELAFSSEANPIGIGLVFGPLLIPLPLLAIAWVVAVIHSSLKGKGEK
jgi:hypothetical protein